MFFLSFVRLSQPSDSLTREDIDNMRRGRNPGHRGNDFRYKGKRGTILFNSGNSNLPMGGWGWASLSWGRHWWSVWWIFNKLFKLENFDDRTLFLVLALRQLLAFHCLFLIDFYAIIFYYRFFQNFNAHFNASLKNYETLLK